MRENYINLFDPGHSHFEQIVNRVKIAVAKRRQNFNTDDLDGLSREERNEVPPETNVCSLLPPFLFVLYNPLLV